MTIEPRQISLCRSSKRAFRSCDCEHLEHRILLSATADTSTVLPGLLSNALAGSSTSTVTYPGGVTVTSSQIITQTETIPRFVSQPTIANVRSGNWADPTIWSLGRVPVAGDRVALAAGTTVQYSTVSNARLNGLEINGVLDFSTSVNTRLTVGNLTVMPTGTLQIGTVSNPVAPGVKAEVVIADQALDPARDPKQYGTGLIALGTVSIHGAPLDLTWERLGAEPKAGNTSLTLETATTTWKKGDTLVLPDTRQVLTSDDKRFPAGLVAPQWEEVTIDHFQGSKVFLTAALKFDHRGAHDVSGQLELLPHVALLDRNVIIRSENPQGTRGHTFFTARANVDIEYARFQDLGRTDAFRALDSTTVGTSGNVTHRGTNQVGRYAVHFHHLMGPVNGSNVGYQFQFIGNTVSGSKKWAVAVHDSSYGLLRGNVVYDAQGAGFVTEDGSEVGNLFANNITIRMQGTHDDGKSGTLEDDYGRGGSGFWFRRGGNALVGNVAADSTYAGFVYDGYYETGPKSLPAFRGADKQQPGAGVVSTLSPKQSAINNEAYGMTTYGLWTSYVAGDNLASNQPETLFYNLSLWNTWLAGVMAYHTSNLTFDNLLILGDEGAQDRNDEGSYGLQLRDYENRNVVVRNSRIEGVRIGVVAPRNDASQIGLDQPTVIQNTSLKNYINILVNPSQDDRPSNGNSLLVRDVKFDLVKTLPLGPAKVNTLDPPANIQMKVSGTALNLTQPSIVKVYNYNQVQGDNFQVFYREQAATYILPQTDATLLSSRADGGTIGSPLSGLNNFQNWTRFGIAMAGAVAPSGAAASRPDINGLIAPIQSPLASSGVVLVTPWQGAQITGTDPVRIRYTVNGVLPLGAVVYFLLDGGKPISKIQDGGLYGLSNGIHTLKVYIGDSTGKQLAGTGSQTVSFVVNLTLI